MIDNPVFWRNPALPFVEGRRAVNSSACYRAHSHPTLSVGIVDSGESVLSVGGSHFNLVAGDVVVINPHEVHSCNPKRNGRWGYRMFYIDWLWIQQTLAPDSFRAPLSEPHPPLRIPGARAAVDQMNDAVCGSLGDEKGVAVFERSLRKLASFLEPKESPKRCREAALPLEWARSFIERHCNENIRQRDLARESGMTCFKFIRRFRAQYGLTPHAYKLDQQITLARGLLAKKASLSEVAYSLGFSDQSHFHRTFKVRVAATPAQYKRGH